MYLLSRFLPTHFRNNSSSGSQSLSNYSRGDPHRWLREGSPIHFFLMFLRYRLAGSSWRFIDQIWITVTCDCRSLFLSKVSGDAAARVTRGRTRHTDGNYAKRLLSRRDDGRKITLSISLLTVSRRPNPRRITSTGFFENSPGNWSGRAQRVS